MTNVASWIRECDEIYFRRFFNTHPELNLLNARLRPKEASPTGDPGWHALLLTGGEDISAAFLKQRVEDPSQIIDQQPERDAWEFNALSQALDRGLPVLAICRGHQVLNVALGGTLHLDIPGHNSPESKLHNVQPMRYATGATHRFERVNSSHHQAIDQLGDGLEAEGWCATDGVIEQVRLQCHPFVLGVQYHPERDSIYQGLFENFFEYVGQV